MVVRAAGRSMSSRGAAGSPADSPTSCATRRSRRCACGRWPIACGRARSMNSSARSRCWAPGKPLRQALETRPAAFADPLGAAGHRQDHAGAADRAPRRRGVHAALGRHGRRQGHPRSRRARARRARRTRAPHRAVPRRSASLQQGAAGHLPAVRRGRHADLHRRDHRESLVRSHQRVVVARSRVRVALARRGGHRQATAPRARGSERGLGKRALAIDDEALVALAHGGDGDARRALGMLEIAADLAEEQRRPRDDHARTGARSRHGRPPPIRQGRRTVLRPDLGAAQGGARHRSGRARCTGSRACSMAAAILTTWRGASCAWPSKTSGSPIRAVSSSRSMPGRPSSGSAVPKASSRSPMRWCISPSRPRAMRCTSPTAKRRPTSSSSARSMCRCASAMRRRSS